MLSIAHSESNIHCVVVLHVCVWANQRKRRISKSNREDTDRRYERRALLHLNPGKKIATADRCRYQSFVGKAL